MKRSNTCRLPTLIIALCLLAPAARAADQPQWGHYPTRNMVSTETGLPTTFNPVTGENIKWIVDLGTESYATPVVAEGCVFIGTNNAKPRDEKHKGDRGVLFCLDEKDGSLKWQLIVPKLTETPFNPYLDWPRSGLCSPVTVEDGRVYALTNRGEAVCLDINGLADGNDGPFTDEARHMTPADEPPLDLGPLDADIIWLFDVHAEVKSYPHDGAHSSLLIDGPFIYLNTNNGVDNTHRRNRAPDAPSLICLEKATGRLIAVDNEKIGGKVFHCTWSSPAIGEVNGRRLVIFGGGDGVVYAFEALKDIPAAGAVETLKRVWRFDCDPTAPKEDIHSYKSNRKVSPSGIMSMPVFHDGRVYVTVGGDIWWGKEEAWLQCIDATKEGDITTTGLVWSYPLVDHCCSTPSVYNGMVFTADCGGFVHCVDARTGKPHWRHEAGGDIWASTLVADNRVYVPTHRRKMLVFAAEKELNLLGTVELDSAASGTATAANGTLYVATMRKLYAAALTKP
ncbi:MAG TPA: PQQ-binding-like beta-propeller repeat protein [Anaerohalosphaeraceae bacterium]|jgi:outer membrane protein assembly factor BamB|nr:PQQ-binding-like beta-propeller repeat protein [Anaerohalosphaeraceae bacterium]HRT51070.1 PQQ-binding-like beta-propeller repeat protein [Anaerohalosphaeraceae bacterium]HRT87085.1 PQQ-binding-like beta-propeller repeat protein [Anaerohalosphaeraceae bacterium]